MIIEIPMITGRIDALPVVMFAWNCPKCGAFHFKVPMGEVVSCQNKKCGEKFDRTMFRFNGADKIAKIMGVMKEELYKVAVKDAESELEKEAAADALAL